MNAETRREGDARPEHCLRIEGEMTIYQAAELKPALTALLEQGDALEIDLSGVSEIDAAGVQLLVAAKKEALARRKELHLAAHSAAVVEAFELLDLGGFFGDPMMIGSGAEQENGRASART
ncbi:MAG TPA: STAS domain-containing protein [Noviherbaspirillum sp.]|uniref:STAS domain-containing protein n=1 Tax=Noviherbaspirillum sp. TaxID=1926288 RepID=UPI002B49D89F|nr:STAS domain-containing protein [Noviherbaspirillum sp.]HJV86091.1 STAS domain-containing protein [Noviherbaspirillum sp.]